MDYALCEYLSEYWIYWVNIYKSNCYGKSMRMNSVLVWEHISLLIFRIMNDAH